MAEPARHPSSNPLLLRQAAVWNILSAREQMARCHICKICLNRISVNLWLPPLIMAFPASSSTLLPGIKTVYSFSTSSCCRRTSRRRSFSSSIMSSHAVFPLSHIAPIPSRPYLADMTEWCCPLAILQTNVSKSWIMHCNFGIKTDFLLIYVRVAASSKAACSASVAWLYFAISWSFPRWYVIFD